MVTGGEQWDSVGGDVEELDETHVWCNFFGSASFLRVLIIRRDHKPRPASPFTFERFRSRPIAYSNVEVHLL